jgi:hypothetical protein
MAGIRHISYFVFLALLLGVLPCLAADRYTDASVDQSGNLRISTNNGRSIIVPKEHDQEGFDHIAISEDGSAVGWVVLYPNCCTSYPIPFKLIVYVNGKTHTFTGTGLPIWMWAFTANGKRVAYEEETVHGGLGVHYELRDVASGRLISQYDPAVGPENQPLPNQSVPSWVTDLNLSWH